MYPIGESASGRKDSLGRNDFHCEMRAREIGL
jgi:hypothetical protein